MDPTATQQLCWPAQNQPGYTIWYHMDRPTNEAIVTGLMLTATPLALPRLRELLAQRLLSFERFRQRVVLHGFPVATPHWEDDPDFDLAAHLHHIALPEPGDQAALCELVGDLISTPLDHTHPLWEMYLIDHIAAAAEQARQVDAAMSQLTATADLLRADGHAIGVVTTGGTGACERCAQHHGVTEVQPGSFIFIDRAYRDALGAQPLPQCAHRRGFSPNQNQGDHLAFLGGQGWLAGGAKPILELFRLSATLYACDEAMHSDRSGVYERRRVSSRTRSAR
jgi:hypothetical protein